MKLRFPFVPYPFYLFFLLALFFQPQLFAQKQCWQWTHTLRRQAPQWFTLPINDLFWLPEKQEIGILSSLRDTALIADTLAQQPLSAGNLTYQLNFEPGGKRKAWQNLHRGGRERTPLITRAPDGSVYLLIEQYPEAPLIWGKDTFPAFSDSVPSLIRYFLARIGAQGERKWITPITPLHSRVDLWEIFQDLKVSRRGKVFLLGYYRSNGLPFAIGDTLLPSRRYDDGFLACYDTAGKWQWARALREDSGSYNNVLTSSLALGPDGSVAVAGSFRDRIHIGATALQDTFMRGRRAWYKIYIARLSDKGQTLWAKAIGCVDSNSPSSLVFAPDTSLYLTANIDPGGLARPYPIDFGEFILSTSRRSLCLAKLSPQGKTLWAKMPLDENGAIGINYRNAACVSPEGNLCLALNISRNNYVQIDSMRFDNPGIRGHNAIFATFTPRGELLEAHRVVSEPLGAVGGQSDFFDILKMLSAPDGSLYITGQLRNSGNIYIPFGKDTIRGSRNDTYFLTRYFCPPTALAPAPPQAPKFTAYPNPFSQSVALQLRLQEAQPLSLTLYDAAGKAVFSQTLQAQAGENGLHLQPPALPPGLYLLEVKSPDWRQTVKLIKQ